MNELAQHPKLILEVLIAYWAFSAIVTGMPKPPENSYWATWVYDTLHLFAGSVKQFADSKMQAISQQTTITKIETTKEATPTPPVEPKP